RSTSASEGMQPRQQRQFVRSLSHLEACLCRNTAAPSLTKRRFTRRDPGRVSSVPGRKCRRISESRPATGEVRCAMGAARQEGVKAMLQQFAAMLASFTTLAKVTFINPQGTLLPQASSWHDHRPAKSGNQRSANTNQLASAITCEGRYSFFRFPYLSRYPRAQAAKPT